MVFLLNQTVFNSPTQRLITMPCFITTFDITKKFREEQITMSRIAMNFPSFPSFPVMLIFLTDNFKGALIINH